MVKYTSKKASNVKCGSWKNISWEKKKIYDTFKMRADKWRSTERMESDTYIVHQM